jgi:hypothetical protein
MGMKYRARRWIVRFLYGATRPVAAVVIALVFTFGFLLGMAFVAQPSRMGFIVRDIMERSSWAEWAAAVGTWVVGWMAFRIGTKSHEQKLLEYNERAEERGRLRAARRNAIARRVAEAGQFGSLMSLVQTTNPYERRALQNFLAYSKTVLPTLKWDNEELGLLNGEEFSELSELISLIDLTRMLELDIKAAIDILHVSDFEISRTAARAGELGKSLVAAKERFLRAFARHA